MSRCPLLAAQSRHVEGQPEYPLPDVMQASQALRASHRHDDVGTGVSVEAAGRPHSSPPANGHRTLGKPRQRTGGPSRVARTKRAVSQVAQIVAQAATISLRDHRQEGLK